MTNVIELPDQQKRYDEASEWLARLDKWEGVAASGVEEKTAMPELEKQALQQWMAAHPENQRLLFEMAELWDSMDTLSRLTGLFPRRDKNQFRPRTAIAIAASFLLATFIGLSTWGGWLSGDTPSANIYQTAIGEHSTVTLPDGTQLMLNTDTRVSVNYSDKHRLIMLSRGEINVSVAKDPNRPLSVVAGNKIVQAVGTEFNVEITDDKDIELVVTEGKVKVAVREPPSLVVSNTSNAVQTAEIQRLPASAVTVSAGEALVMTSPNKQSLLEDNVTVTEVTQAEIEVKLSWQKGNLVFRGESLEEAIKEVGRYTAVEFVFVDEDLKSVRVAGLFKAGDVEGLLAALRENFNIVSQLVDGEKVLLGTGKASIDP
jgi:transmembrane sensor